MLLILLVYFINILIITALGDLFHRLFLKNKPSLRPFLWINGLLFLMIIIWIILYFGGFPIYYTIFLVIFSFFYLYKNPQSLFWGYRRIKTFPALVKIFLVFALIIILLLSSIQSTIPDNESYYIQTIKWANVHGMVKGLMNIHPFLGQFSGWHILQAGLNFHQKWLTFNDLNGLFFLIFVFYWSLQYQKNTWPENYWFRLFPALSVLFIFFLEAPSPDLPVILLSLMVFDLFVQNYAQLNRHQFIEILLLSGFSFLIKPTAIINLLLVFILWWRHRQQLYKISIKICLFLFIILGLWLSKNYIISGYLFYPFNFLHKSIKPVWQYPPEMLHYLSQLGNREHMTLSLNSHIITGFWHWLHQPGIHQIINPLMVFLLTIFPIILMSTKQNNQFKKPYLRLYLAGLFYFIVILFMSPNFRFFLPFLIFLSLTILSFCCPPVFTKYLNSLGWIIFLFIGFFWAIHNNWSYQNLIFPEPVSIYNQYDSQKEGQIRYNFPVEKELFWQTGNAPLPAIHPKLIEFFKTKFGVIPQKNVEKNYYYENKISK